LGLMPYMLLLKGIVKVDLRREHLGLRAYVSHLLPNRAFEAYIFNPQEEVAEANGLIKRNEVSLENA
jgi:hypothetical protein